MGTRALMRYTRDKNLRHFHNGVIPKIDECIRNAGMEIDCSVTVTESCGDKSGRFVWQCVFPKDDKLVKLGQFLYRLYKSCGTGSICISRSGSNYSTSYDVPIYDTMHSCLTDVIRDAGMSEEDFSLDIPNGMILGGRVAVLYGADNLGDVLVQYEYGFKPNFPISYNRVSVEEFFAPFLSLD